MILAAIIIAEKIRTLARNNLCVDRRKNQIRTLLFNLLLLTTSTIPTNAESTTDTVLFLWHWLYFLKFHPMQSHYI